MNKKFFVLFALLFTGYLMFAQVAVDPQHDFYRQVERWETSGLIQRQNSMRPYPVALVERILNEVIESENERESEIAKNLYSDIFDRPWKLKLSLTDREKIKKENDTVENKDTFYAYYGIDGDLTILNRTMGFSYKGDCLTKFARNWGNVLPIHRPLTYYESDTAYIGPTQNSFEFDGSYSAAFKNCFFQAGIGHMSFGPFYDDSIVFSPYGKHSSNFIFSYNPGRFNFTQSVSIISASAVSNPDRWYPDKYFIMHSVDYNFTSWLSASFYETAIFGKRFEYTYLIPIPVIAIEGVTGFDEDNLLSGVTLTLRPVKGLSMNVDYYLDDIGFYGLKDYHAIKMHAAAQAGLKYVPQNYDWLRMLKLNYTMVTPFMYPHGQPIFDPETGVTHPGSVNAVNYQNYTHAGRTLGAQLNPNSDKIAFTANFKPVKGLSVDVGATFIRHANVNEGLSRSEIVSYLASPSGYFITDGTIGQSAMYFPGGKGGYSFLPSSQNKTMFLTQPTKEYIFQGDIDLAYDLSKTKIGNFTVGVGYTFEYVHNYGVNTEIFPGGKVTDGMSEEEITAVIDDCLNNWKSQLRDLYAHYIRVNFKYTF